MDVQSTSVHPLSTETQDSVNFHEGAQHPPELQISADSESSKVGQPSPMKPRSE